MQSMMKTHNIIFKEAWWSGSGEKGDHINQRQGQLIVWNKFYKVHDNKFLWRKSFCHFCRMNMNSVCYNVNFSNFDFKCCICELNDLIFDIHAKVFFQNSCNSCSISNHWVLIEKVVSCLWTNWHVVL
jgi:hypothetical protein